MARRVEQLFESPDRLEALVRIEMADQLHLLHSDAVLARYGTARGNAVLENVFAGLLGALQLAGLAGIEENDGMQVPISRVEDIADGETVALGNLVDVAQRGGDLGAGHHAILHVIRWADAAHRPERVLAALP